MPRLRSPMPSRRLPAIRCPRARVYRAAPAGRKRSNDLLATRRRITNDGHLDKVAAGERRSGGDRTSRRISSVSRAEQLPRATNACGTVRRRHEHAARAAWRGGRQFGRQR
jgi:hypothetical protein